MITELCLAWFTILDNILQEKDKVDHPKDFEENKGVGDERDSEDKDGFFEPWSHTNLNIPPSNGLEIIVGFLAVKSVDASGQRILGLPNEILDSWDLNEEKIVDWANSWWSHGQNEPKNYLPKFVLYQSELNC